MITVDISRKNLVDLAIVGDKREANFFLHSLFEDALSYVRNLVRSDPSLLLITEGAPLKSATSPKAKSNAQCGGMMYFGRCQ